MHKLCGRIFLKGWTFQLEVPRAGESRRGLPKAVESKITAQESHAMEEEREREEAGKNRGRDVVHFRMMPQTGQEGDLEAGGE